MLPNFLVIGAQKSGTTWFHNVLREHPDIFVPRTRKETEYLDTQRHFEAGTAAYEAHFAGAEGFAAVGEVTPGYLWCAERFAKVFPVTRFRRDTPLRARSLLGADLRLIVILRDPVRRAISAYLHHMDRGRFEPGTRFLTAGRRYGIIAMGFYAANLSRWLEQFSMRNFLFLSYEDISRDPEAGTRAAFAFLGVDRDFRPEATGRRFTARAYRFAPSGVTVERDGGRVTLVDGAEIERLARLYTVPNRHLARLIPDFPLDEWTKPSCTPPAPGRR